MSLQEQIESAITKRTGTQAKILDSKIAYGGCINESRIVELEDGRQYFIKTHPAANTMPGLFESEYKALELLSEPDVIHVPKPIAYDKDFIVMEVFTQGPAAKDWHQQIGRRLALLHQSTQQDSFGFETNNYLGTSSQKNDWCESWLEFWREQRLAYQLELFASKTTKDDPLLVSGKKLIDKLDYYLGDIDEPAVLLHGDLWSGNAAADEKGAPVIFDPASYYGHRETEIGMMRMFGGFGPDCEAAYNEVWPFEQGFEDRVKLYRLYHQLNHLNLFGHAYYQSCLSTIQSLI